MRSGNRRFKRQKSAGRFPGAPGGAGRLRPALLAILALCIVFLLAGCGGGGGADGGGHYEPDPAECGGAAVSGAAYYPFYSESGEPEYFDDQNFDIIVTLHDRNGNPVADDVTAESGRFSFDGLAEGAYFLTAYAEDYDPVSEGFHVYLVESGTFYLTGCEWLSDRNLFLKYSHTEQ